MTDEHDYVLIWSHGAPIPGYTANQVLNFDLEWAKDLHDPDVPIADHGVYYVYFPLFSPYFFKICNVRQL